MMRFISTRGQAPETDIIGAALSGLAPDGGLYLPMTWPQLSAARISAMADMSYPQIAFTVLQPFFAGALSDSELQKCIQQAYRDFEIDEVVKLQPFDEHFYLLELFHGPTLAFKDIAMQFLGQIFAAISRRARQRMSIIGATSGDTGSAAIAAFAGHANIDLTILYPIKGPSEIQRRQMTTVTAPNVHALGVDGNFDDCQAIVKQIFADTEFRVRHHLTTINSINLLRILAQMVYYFYAASRCRGVPGFVVPSGNFGNIYAGYAAMKCGLPIARLAAASNSNDTVARFLNTGILSPKAMQLTLSPSMDIQISSNLERLLFDLCGRDPAPLRDIMKKLSEKKSLMLSTDQLTQMKNIFAAAHADDERTLKTMADFYQSDRYILDPHTAVGVKAARDLAADLPQPVICLATAHAAKFPSTVRLAIGKNPDAPPRVAKLMQPPERIVNIAADVAAVKKFMERQDVVR